MGINCLIQIGNSDNKLTQQEWANFVKDMRGLLRAYGRGTLQVHGEWFSLPDQPWQNANWSVEVREPAWWRVAVERVGQDTEALNDPMQSASAVHMRDQEMRKVRAQLKTAVRSLCFLWRQDSFAWTEAPVELVETGYEEPTTPGGLTPTPTMAQAIREGWLPAAKTEIEEGARSPYLNEEDRRRITAVLERNRREQTPGATGDSTSAPAPASTGDAERAWCADPSCLIAHTDGPCVPAFTGTTSKHTIEDDWARTENQLRGTDGITMKPSQAAKLRDAARNKED